MKESLIYPVKKIVCWYNKIAITAGVNFINTSSKLYAPVVTLFINANIAS